MAIHDGITGAAAPSLPALLIVDADAQARAATEGALARGFEADYRVLSADAPQAGLDIVQGLTDRTIGGLHTWLIRADLATPEDITT